MSRSLPDSLRVECCPDREALLVRLQEIDISLPFRGTPRNRKKEIRSASRLISTISEEFLFPLEVTIRGDSRSPDCIIISTEKSIGLEITTTPSGDFCDGMEFATQLYPEGYFAEFSENKVRIVSAEDAADWELTEPPVFGDDGEIGWAGLIRAACDKKTTKLSGGKYERYDEDWLFVNADTWHPVRTDRVSRHIDSAFKGYWDKHNVFTRVFCEVRNHLICVSQDGVKMKPVHDVWSEK